MFIYMSYSNKLAPTADFEGICVGWALPTISFPIAECFWWAMPTLQAKTVSLQFAGMQ